MSNPMRRGLKFHSFVTIFAWHSSDFPQKVPQPTLSNKQAGRHLFNKIHLENRTLELDRIQTSFVCHLFLIENTYLLI